MSAPLKEQRSNIDRSANSSPLDLSNRSTSSPSYSLSLPPFPASFSSPGSLYQNLPNQNPQHGQRYQTQQIDNGISNLHTPPRHSLATHPYGIGPSSSQAYLNPPTSAFQHSSFPAYLQPSPSQQLPNPFQVLRLSPISAARPSAGGPQGHSPSQNGGCSLPAMEVPIPHFPDSNIQKAHIGGMSLQHPYRIGEKHMYDHNKGHQDQQQQQYDRPFKCHQCAQGFNRSHDLKRHQRIHLAVKPYPCIRCERSFSRKDALKRHIDLKTCGETLTVASDRPDQAELSNKVSEMAKVP
ncbi:hypothetical protein OIDMADRAFT_33584 [Oidiodendron maius Zn]|uniref:C2H2-type domain-containing protein n=1 Tax=Oidiodendron maius (strain Zn) TaxID=913774 RepID=A0A0C3D2S5_OIDMZ|nr:hypothetical protein OIDMADRAFT_33584 [Oidiodendron maius Zn]